MRFVAWARSSWRTSTAATAAAVATTAAGFFAAPPHHARAAAGPMKESMEAAINDELHDYARGPTASAGMTTLVASAVAGAVAVPTTADAAAPSRQVFDVSIERLTGRCGFPVSAQWQGKVAVISFTNSDGDVVKTIEPVAGKLEVTVTNLATGKALALHASGPGIGEEDPDFGFISFTTLGTWLVFQDPVSLQRGVFLIAGRRELTSEGFDFHGRVVDLCPELARSDDGDQRAPEYAPSFVYMGKND
jgi:hypothetical protein